MSALPSPILERAEARGFTRHVEGSDSEADYRLAIAPDADLDGHFDAVCLDTGDTLIVNGWLVEWAAA